MQAAFGVQRVSRLLRPDAHGQDKVRAVRSMLIHSWPGQPDTGPSPISRRGASRRSHRPARQTTALFLDFELLIQPKQRRGETVRFALDREQSLALRVTRADDLCQPHKRIHDTRVARGGDALAVYDDRRNGFRQHPRRVGDIVGGQFAKFERGFE
ncbi:MAG: hypothetical protein MZV64_62825 [Ignavibacteriales bacterium]|nr:hypothetical protein [Ignavibacteriales bacterium]